MSCKVYLAESTPPEDATDAIELTCSARRFPELAEVKFDHFLKLVQILGIRTHIRVCCQNLVRAYTLKAIIP